MTMLRIVNLTLLVVGVVNLVIGTVYLGLGNAVVGPAAMTAGLLLLLAATVDRFEVLKGMGIEAKVRELRQTIDEADNVLARLLPVTEFACSSLVDVSMRGGRIGTGLSVREGYELAHAVTDVMRAAGADKAKIEKALQPWVFYSAFDLAQGIRSLYAADVKRQLAEARKAGVRVDQASGASLGEAIQERQDLVRDLTAYEVSLREDLHAFNLDQFVPYLASVSQSVPAIVALEAREKLQTLLAVWLPELEFLVENSDYKSPELWLEHLEDIKNGRMPPG